MKKTSTVAFAVTALFASACTDGAVSDGSDRDTPMERSFRLRIENIAPWTVIKSGVQTTRTSGTDGPLGPGDAYEITFTAGAGQSVSFASMLGESNDWFFGPGPAGIALYDGTGSPRSGDVTSEIAVWDAGTEIDEEPFVGGSTGPQQLSPDQGAADPNPVVRALGQTVTLSGGGTFAMPAVEDMITVTLTAQSEQRFVLRIENVSTDETLVTSAGPRAVHMSPPLWAVHIAPAPLFDEGAADRGEGLEQIAEAGRTGTLATTMHSLTGFHTPLSPGVYAISAEGEPLFSVGVAERGLGLERIAEDGNPMPLAQAVSAEPPAGTMMTGAFTVPAGIDVPGPALPGRAFEIDFDAMPGDHLSFATMFGMSNDWFFASRPEGIPLFDANGVAMSGDVTELVELYDAGTEIDQEIAIGPATGPQQGVPDTGAVDPIAQVRLVSPSDYAQPVSTHLRVTLEVVDQ